MRVILGRILLLAMLLPSISFALFETTPGEQFRARLKSLEAECKRDPPEPGNTRCDLLKVQVEDWLATPEGRFAHSIKIPNPVPENSGYRKGMKPHEYFEHLCKTEAGEFIFKTVDNVEGIRLLRPRQPVDSDYKFRHLYSMEDPYGHLEGEAEEPGFQFIGLRKYRFIETPVGMVNRPSWLWRYRDPSLFEKPPSGAILERYTAPNTSLGMKALQLEYATAFSSRYGVIWRGIRRPNDREMGIAGGELIVLDLDTNEVLGVRRGYALYRGSWEIAPVCPRYGYAGGFDKSFEFTTWFVAKVARPREWKEFFGNLEKHRVKRGN